MSSMAVILLKVVPCPPSCLKIIVEKGKIPGTDAAILGQDLVPPKFGSVLWSNQSVAAARAFSAE